MVGSTGFDLVVGEEGREEATMDREEKVVGSVDRVLGVVEKKLGLLLVGGGTAGMDESRERRLVGSVEKSRRGRRRGLAQDGPR